MYSNETTLALVSLVYDCLKIKHGIIKNNFYWKNLELL